MLLALCAYSGRLSPSLDSTTSGILGGTGEAGKVAADLWYEQSRTAVSADMKKGSSVETVQTLLLLSLRDHGRGFESQAWLLVGLAVRMAQDLDLNEDDSNANRPDLLPEDRQTRRNIWGVSSMLDLFLSLQLGRPPAIMDALRPTGPSHSNNWQSNAIPSSLIPELTPTIQSQTLFAHTVALCHIMARINFHFYLGFSPVEAQPQTEKLLELKAELDMWQHALPHKYRISIGHQPEREVLEVNMLYHVAIILLYRPL
ncbi:fungal-specific transcription factor domain-containing protein [Collybia nuda]|uniref:Fungal-specific transcription factor domain-containing protein n=1 Tax=Collybia nuda TaxID=64659 RepID=A0A9P6CH86_9AGAR|nr:fungal-specific transcription factor domain-containing protein [Collybia nuda]